MTLEEIVEEAISILEDIAESDDPYAAQTARGGIKHLRKLLEAADYA